MRDCQGVNCAAGPQDKHSDECLFEHFLTYTQFSDLSVDIVVKLRKAYFDGLEAGRTERI